LITDLIFAVDSVSAVVAEVPDLFLAYTASVFAVLNLRAMFFVTDQLIHMFVLLKYGIASILVIIGVKLMLKEWLHIPALVMIGLLISIVTLCIIGSLLLNKYNAWRERNSPDQRNSPEQVVSH
jgi:predicted tellurium resistance membrane protein TerC